jgi:hypothetical protein
VLPNIALLVSNMSFWNFVEDTSFIC